MSASKNKLLTTLSALGLVAAGAIAPVGLAAYAAEGGPATEARRSVLSRRGIRTSPLAAGTRRPILPLATTRTRTGTAAPSPQLAETGVSMLSICRSLNTSYRRISSNV